MIDIIKNYYPLYISGLKITLLVSLVSVVLGSILGIFIAVLRLSKNRIISKLVGFYIEIIRGTPILVQVFIIVYGLPSLGIKASDLVGCIIALTLNSAAYIAEIIRSGIQSVDDGQMEAARSLGMSYTMSMKSIILPQAIKNILPALGNEFVTLIKESAIVSIVGVQDLMYGAQIIRGSTCEPFVPLLIAAGIYFIVTSSLSSIIRTLERKLEYND